MVELSSLTSQEIKNLIKKFDENKLLTKVYGKNKIDLGVFNNSLQTASKNLGIIIPSIIEVSKEQVAVINHGLEGVINFVRAFQTVNTTFALLTENPNDVVIWKNKLNNIQSLESHIVDDVKDTLVNLDKMLKESFKEVSVYYSALGQIIYSETAEGTIKLKYERSGKLKELMNQIYRRDVQPTNISLQKSLGLVQLIKSLTNVSRSVKSIEIDSETQLKYYEIIGSKDGKDKKIKLDIDVLKSLQSLSGELLNSLNRVGLLVQNENGEVQVMKANLYQQKVLSQYGVEIISESINALRKDKGVVEYFIKQCEHHAHVSITSRGDNSAKKYSATTAILSEAEKAKKVHDDIVKRQIVFINKVIEVFIKIVSLWGDQVDNELHVGQVADKAVIALKKLSQVELKMDSELDSQSLLLTVKSQDSIRETCNKAKDLKSVGKVMQFLLKRLKSIVSFNEGLENGINSYHRDSERYRTFQRAKLKRIKELIYNRFPDMSNKISRTVTRFNKLLAYLTNSRNVYENTRLFNEFEQHYRTIDNSFTKFVKELNKKIETVTPENFRTDCEELGSVMQILQNNVDNLFDNFNSLKQTFNNDFRKYIEISDAYKMFVKEISPILDLITYIIGVQKRLASERVELKTLNYRIKAFQEIFKKLKHSQKEQASLDTNLRKVMRSVGMARDSNYYYKKYTQRMDVKLRTLFKKLEEYVNTYFSDSKRMKRAYNEVNKWIKTFDVNFKEYNLELKGMKIGFFQKLFKTQSYKKSQFWDRLKKVQKSFSLLDVQIHKLGKINLHTSNNVKTFCSNSVVVVKVLLGGYKTVVSEMDEILNTMDIVVKNLNTLTSEGYISKFSELFNNIQSFNTKLDDIENRTFDLEEFDTFDVREILDSVRNVTTFEVLRETTDIQAIAIKNYKRRILYNVELVREKLIEFFSKYLIEVYGNLDKSKKYIKIIEGLRKKRRT